METREAFVRVGYDYDAIRTNIEKIVAELNKPNVNECGLASQAKRNIPELVKYIELYDSILRNAK